MLISDLSSDVCSSDLLGAYVSGLLSARYGVPALVDIVCAIALTALSAIVVALPTLRLRGHYLAMATLGFNAILSVLFVELVGLTGGPNGLSGVDSFSIFGLAFDSDKWFFYLAWAVSLLLMWGIRSEEHTSELQSLMRISYAVFCL